MSFNYLIELPETCVISAAFARREVLMPWKETVMEERLRFVAQLLDGESMTAGALKTLSHPLPLR
jgi:hypothetical protein